MKLLFLQRRFLICVAALLVVCGCSQEDVIQKFSSPEDQATAKGYVDRLRAHDFGAIENAMDQSVRDQNLHGVLVKMADLIPAQEPTSIRVVGAHTFHAAGATTVSTTFEYNFDGKWLIANVAVQDKDGTKTVVGFHVNPEPASLESQNRFSLSDKGAIQYLLLVAAVVASLLTVYSLVVCIRTKLPGRKWPWVLFIIVGFGKFAVNWTTGGWEFTPLGIQLFSAAAFAEFYGPWIISVSIPVGAVSFLIYRRRLLASGTVP